MHENHDTEQTPPPLCPGRCNFAFRAAERRYNNTGTSHDIQPWDGQPVWCPPCTTAIRAAIADWPDNGNHPGLATLLVEEIESGVSAGMSEYVSGSKDRPVHDHEPASFLLDEYAGWISEWEDTIRHDRELTDRKPTADPVAAVTGASAFLLANLDWHLGGREEQYDIPVAQIIEEFGKDLLRYHRRAQTLTATQDVEPVRVAGVPCPICDCKALEHEVETEAGRRQQITRFQYDGNGEVRNHLRPMPAKLTEQATVPTQGAATGHIRCRRCRPAFRMSPEEYLQWTRLLAAGEKARALATREKLAEIFGNSVPTQYKAKQ